MPNNAVALQRGTAVTVRQSASSTMLPAGEPRNVSVWQRSGRSDNDEQRAPRSEKLINWQRLRRWMLCPCCSVGAQGR